MIYMLTEEEFQDQVDVGDEWICEQDGREIHVLVNTTYHDAALCEVQGGDLTNNDLIGEEVMFGKEHFSHPAD